MTFKYLRLLLLLVCGCLPFVAPRAAAQQSGLTSMTLKSLGYDTSTLRGALSSSEFFIPGPGAVQITASSKLRLHLSYTDLLRGERSSVSVRLNGHDTASVPLQDSKGSEQWLEVPLSPALIKPDFNSLQIVFNLRRDQGSESCADASDPVLWATIFPDSTIIYERGEPLRFDEPLELSKYPAPIYRTEYGPRPTIPVLVPTTPTTNTLVGAASLLASLGQAAAGRTLQPVAVTAETLSAQATLVIGTGRDFPWLAEQPLPLKYDHATGQYFDGKNQPIAPEIGVIQLFTHQRNGAAAGSVLLVSGGNDIGVRRAALALASRTYAKLLHGTYALIPQEPNVEKLGKDGITPGQQTFGQLTASDNDPTVRNQGRSSVSATFYVPQSYRFDQEPQVSLHFSHASGLDERSLLTIEINGTSIASTRLDDKNATGGTLTTKLPTSVLRSGANTIAATFQMRQRDAQPCPQAFDDVVWGTLHHDSSITLPFSDSTPQVDLSTLSAPFVQAGAIQNTLVVLPPRPDQLAISQTLTLAARLGAETKSDLTYLPVALTSDGATLPAQHLIVVGTPALQPLIGALQRTLPLEFNAAGVLEWRGSASETPNAPVLLAVQNEQAVGILQIAVSPWHNDRSVLLVSGTTEPAIGWAIDALTDGALTGNVALATADAHISTLSVRQSTPTDVTAVRNESPIWIAILAGVLALALLGITIGIALRTMRANSQEDL